MYSLAAIYYSTIFVTWFNKYKKYKKLEIWLQVQSLTISIDVYAFKICSKCVFEGYLIYQEDQLI